MYYLMNALLALFAASLFPASAVSEESFAAQVQDLHAQLDPGDKIYVQAFLPNNPEKSNTPRILIVFLKRSVLWGGE